jgi:ABC-type multidrug transport system ATPase subunit
VLTHVHKADYVLVLKDGRIQEEGAYSDLMLKNGTLAQLLNDYGPTGKRADEGYEGPKESANEDTEGKKSEAIAKAADSSNYETMVESG